MPDDEDVTPRRTWLAAERTFLAWWRTGLATAVAALAVGRILPEVVTGSTWAYAALGLGYGVVAIAIFALTVHRERSVDESLRHGSEFRPLSGRLAVALAGAGVLLTLATMALIAVDA
jgi:putative membrane protein